MAYELIPFPIAVLFVTIFALAALVVLWKLRRRGKAYFALFSLSVILLLGFIVLFSIGVAFTSHPNGGGPVEIEITTNKPSFEPNEKVNFSIYINNPHDWAVHYPSSISYHINSGYGDTGTILPNSNNLPPLAPHSRTFMNTYPWSQSQPGNYTLTVTLRGTVDYGKPANYTVEIKPAQ